MQLECDLEPSMIKSRLSILDEEIAYIKNSIASLTSDLRWKNNERSRLLHELKTIGNF